MLRISVIGGGLGGLAFAQGMRRLAGYQVTVYERDKSPSQRSQGYQIGLNEQGLDSLKSLELPGFTELIRENPLFGFMMTDSKLDALVRFSIGGTAQEPKTSLVNRWKLHDLLMEGIDIQWDKKFVSYEEKNDCIIATFEDGTTATSALLVGADGVNSKVVMRYWSL
jgi:salicylate hydroxylase